MLSVTFLCASIIAAYAMTPIFRSEGVILIEEGDIPEDLISTTVRGFVEERVELVRKRVFVPEHINEAIATFSLYVAEDP